MRFLSPWIFYSTYSFVDFLVLATSLSTSNITCDGFWGEYSTYLCIFFVQNRYSCLRLNLRGFKDDLQYSYALTSCVTDELIIYTHMRRAMIFYYHLHGLMLSLKSNLSTLQRFVFLTKCSESIMEITGINMLWQRLLKVCH